MLVVGVNGTGKTTTIGKIAWQLSKEFGLSVVLAAADTFRAAAAEQLAIGPSGRAPTWSAQTPAPTPAPSPSMRSPLPAPAAPTS